MANFNDKILGVIEGLSDFWLLYFKEIDQLKVLYQGTDVLLGQSYLDLISLLLNNSLEDAPLFNKELFKLIQIKETEIKFLQRSNATRSKYVYTPLDALVNARALNNKILNVTSSLERDIDFDVNDENRTFEFKYDPLNAYLQTTFGTGNSAFTLRTKDPLVQQLSVALVDNGISEIEISRNASGTEVTISYDGPANTGTALARDIVSTVNLHPVFSGLLFAELDTTDGGSASPAAVALTPLVRLAVNPLDDFATRVVDQVFGGKLTSNRVSNWLAFGIQKGDIIRLLTGPTIASPQELTVSLLRTDGLYTNPDNLITDIKASDKTTFSILREPEDNTSTGEPFPNTGAPVQTGNNGVIVAVTRQFSSVTAVFSAVHEGSIIEILGTSNLGYARILSVVNSTTVVLASTVLVDETNIQWNLITNLSPSTILNDGQITVDSEGVAYFTSASAPFVSTVDAVGTAIVISRAGVLERYEIIRKVSTTQVVINAPDVLVGSGLLWGWARYVVAPVNVIFPYIKSGSVTINARRFVDEQAVVEGRDYVVQEDMALIQPRTVWRTDVGLQLDYQYRLVVVPPAPALQTGSDGTLTYGSPSQFSSPTAAFNYGDIGQAIEITNSGLNPTNNGVYYIASVLSATSVTLTTDRNVSSTVETNNGTLGWNVRRMGIFQTDGLSALVRESSFWAPDALVDRYHLYNTFGYLINRFDVSNENYRSLIRGIFQLFMLGPTLERFESAVNTVAGLSVVRDNGEILLGYTTGQLQTGTDGVFDATTKIFTAASASFTPVAAARYIYATTGLNENRLYKIEQYLSTTAVVLSETPVSDSLVTWELASNAFQEVLTSKRTYTFARTVPLRSAVKDSNNFGVKIFRAFEVLTDVFSVTDYVESPTWWERVQIPEQLWEGEDALRRQSTPALFENTIGASDEPRIGDPGFFIGADSQGFVPPSVLQYDDGGLLDGVLTGDPMYPFTNNVYFATTTNALFTSNDLGNVLVVGGVRYRIIEVISSTSIKLEAFVRVLNASGLAWQVESQPVALRHKAAFVVLDTWLKYHLFSLSFDPSLLGQLGAELINDLQALVLIAKPTYTYVIVTPSSLFKEIIRIEEEDINVQPSINLGGSEGEVISGNASPLLILGSSWRIGNWYRYIENSGSFTAPAASITNVLGVPDAGYTHYITKVVFTDSPAEFTSNGRPIPHAGHVEKVFASGVGAAVSFDGSNWQITLPTAVLADALNGAVIRITGGVVNAGANNRDHYIGRIVSSTVATIGTYASPGAETGLTWQLVTHGGISGYIRNTEDGETLFTDASGAHTFDLTHVGHYIRYAFTSFTENARLRIGYVASNNNTTCRIFELVRVMPIEGDPDFTGALSGNTLTASAALFSPEMCKTQRSSNDSTTALKDQYYAVITSGPNAGQRRRLENRIDDFNVELAGAALTTDPIADYYIEVEQHPAVEMETSTWEHLKNFVVINGNTLDLSNTPTQDAATPVLYTAYGVREPIDPSLEVFDASQGDTYYAIGMPDPRPKQGRSRTGQDTDLREDPIQITRT